MRRAGRRTRRRSRTPGGRTPICGTSSRSFRLALIALVASGGPLLALTPLAVVRHSPDVTALLGGSVVPDEGLVEDDLAGGVTPIALGPLPAEADLAAYERLDDGSHLLVFDTVVALPALVATPRDVVRCAGGACSLFFTGATAGIPTESRIDALARTAAGGLVLSFDTSITFTSLRADDSDLLLFAGGPPAFYLSAAAAGIAPELDVDAVHLLASGHLLLSFETGGTVGGLTFADEDVLELDPAGPSWELAYDGRAQHPGWGDADLDALWAVEGPPGPPPPAGEIRFVAALFVANETDPTATIAVERVGGSAGAVGVSFFTADLSATAASDYVATAGSLGWADGELGVKTFAVPLLDDAAPAGPETVRLVLTGPTGGAVLGVPAIAVLAIQDDEAPSVIDVPALGGPPLAALALLLAAAACVALRRQGG